MGYTMEDYYSPDFDFLTLIAPEHHSMVKENFSRHIRGQEVLPYEYAITTKDGGKIERLSNAESLFDRSAPFAWRDFELDLYRLPISVDP